MYKIFDKQSKLSIYNLGKIISDQELKKWLSKQLEMHKDIICKIAGWRGNLIGHRNIKFYLKAINIEERFPLTRNDTKKLESFLLSFLKRFYYSVYHRDSDYDKKIEWYKECYAQDRNLIFKIKLHKHIK